MPAREIIFINLKSTTMENNNNYFTFLGQRYEGTLDDAWTMYQATQYHVFKDFLKDNIKTVN